MAYQSPFVRVYIDGTEENDLTRLSNNLEDIVPGKLLMDFQYCSN